MAADDPEDCRKPESASRDLGRKERIEDARERFSVHAAARIRDLREYEFARREVLTDAVLSEVVAGGEHAAGGDLYPAGRSSERVRRVRHVIHDALKQLRRVGLDVLLLIRN